MADKELCGGKTFKEVMEEVNFHIFDKHKIEQLQKENAELKEQVEDWKVDHEHNLELMKGLNGRIAELKMQIEKMESFIHSEFDFCIYCPLTTDCLNDEGTCPYAGISEDEQKKLLTIWILNKCELAE